MKKILNPLTILCCFIPSLLWAQDIEVKRERIFPATAMYGYMNGGTDQFLEYNVQKLTVSEIVYKGEDYTVEVYEMPSPENAFGIYSLHVFKCNRTDDTFNDINCLSPYQLQAASGNIYLSVVFPSGSDLAKANVDEVARIYVSGYNQEISFIPELLKLKVPVSGNLKYLKGPLSLSKTNFSLTKLLENIKYSGIWYLPDKSTKTYKALIDFTNQNEVEKLINRMPSNDILEKGENYIYIKGNEKEEIEEDLGNFGF